MSTATRKLESRPELAEPHFRNGRFFNPGVPPQRFGAFLKWITQRRIGPWPAFVPSVPGPPPPRFVSGRQLRVTFVNHSTFLLQTQDCNLLTDPVWSHRASPVRFAGPRRHRAPAIDFDDLPPIDCVLISHNHYDHFDRSTLRRLATRDNPAVFCPLGLARPLARLGFRQVYQLDWQQQQPWRGFTLHCVPAQHFSARTPFDRNRTLWCGWVLDTPHGQIYFAGDTGFGGHFSAIATRFRHLRLALLPIGAYKPQWFMGPIHMDPAEAVEAHAILRAATSIGIHYGTFPLADDGESEPLDQLGEALAEARHEAPFLTLHHGEGYSIP